MNLADQRWVGLTVLSSRVTESLGGRFDFETIVDVEFGTELAEGFCAGRLVCWEAGVAEKGGPAQEGGDIGLACEEIAEKESVLDWVRGGGRHHVEDQLAYSLEICRFILVI